VVQHNIEDDIHPELVGVVDQLAQFAVGFGGGGSEARFGGQEVLNAIAVVGSLIELRVLQHRGEPDGPDAQISQVRQLRSHSFKGASLKSSKRSIERQVPRWCPGIVEAV